MDLGERMVGLGEIGGSALSGDVPATHRNARMKDGIDKGPRGSGESQPN